MNTLIVRSLATGTLLALGFAAPALSQTPDGITPAEENVCDPLADATPGLYGLCVAYCEAHDADLVSQEGNLAELKAPDQRILDKYNKKKKESDPPMPCVLDVGECPCWTAVQLEEMLPPNNNWNFSSPKACRSTDSVSLIENFEHGADGPAFRLAVYAYEGCSVSKFRGFSGGPPSGWGSTTSEEENACKTLLTRHARKYSTEAAWNCFD